MAETLDALCLPHFVPDSHQGSYPEIALRQMTVRTMAYSTPLRKLELNSLFPNTDCLCVTAPRNAVDLQIRDDSRARALLSFDRLHFGVSFLRMAELLASGVQSFALPRSLEHTNAFTLSSHNRESSNDRVFAYVTRSPVISPLGMRPESMALPDHRPAHAVASPFRHHIPQSDSHR